MDQQGIYEGEVIFPCGRIPGEVEVLTQDCRPYFYVPCAFSPNGDDVNDTFQAVLQSPIEVLDFQFRVYDRWGRKMAEWTDPNFEWDGSNLSGNVRPGVYMWEVPEKPNPENYIIKSASRILKGHRSLVNQV